MFGIKFDTGDSSRGAGGSGATKLATTSTHLNLSPQIAKGSNLDSVKKNDYLNSSIGSISLKKLDSANPPNGGKDSVTSNLNVKR